MKGVKHFRDGTAFKGLLRFSYIYILLGWWWFCVCLLWFLLRGVVAEALASSQGRKFYPLHQYYPSRVTCRQVVQQLCPDFLQVSVEGAQAYGHI